MLKRLLLPLALLIPWLSSAPVPTLAADNSVLSASPYMGHSGDVIWLSGSGLLPERQYELVMACPIWFDHNVYSWGNLMSVTNGPVTDENGRFTRFRMRALILHHLPSSSCFIYSALPEENGLGPNQPAQYYIAAQGTKLPACVTHICGTVNLSTKAARAGHLAALDIVSSHWGGAFATVTISFKGTKPLRIKTSLDWAGRRHVTVHVPPQVSHISTANVSVAFHLGQTRGRTTTQFTVVR
jgi:hypothetical protein